MERLFSKLSRETTLEILENLDSETLFYLQKDAYFSTFLREMKVRNVREWKEVEQIEFIIDDFEDWILKDGNILMRTKRNWTVRESSLSEAMFITQEVAKLEQNVAIVIRISPKRVKSL